MTSRERKILDLINDQTCIAMMVRDGVKTGDILNLMNSVKPLVALDRSYLWQRRQVQMSQFAA